MDDFGTYQGALNIFRNVNCVGQTENCIIGTIVDYSRSSEFTASMAGYGALGPAGYVIRKSVKNIKITLQGGKKLFFNANMSEKTLPYQENAMKQVVGRFI